MCELFCAEPVLKQHSAATQSFSSQVCQMTCETLNFWPPVPAVVLLGACRAPHVFLLSLLLAPVSCLKQTWFAFVVIIMYSVNFQQQHWSLSSIQGETTNISCTVWGLLLCHVTCAVGWQYRNLLHPYLPSAASSSTSSSPSFFFHPPPLLQKFMMWNWIPKAACSLRIHLVISFQRYTLSSCISVSLTSHIFKHHSHTFMFRLYLILSLFSFFLTCSCLSYDFQLPLPCFSTESG